MDLNVKKLIQIRLREHGKIDFFEQNEQDIGFADLCIVESDYGKEYGQAISNVALVPEEEIEDPAPKKIIRKANSRDIESIEKNRRETPEALKKCVERVQSRNMLMKMVAAEYSLDRSKVVFYFTAEGRVDFRELVKDLAGVFKARIELRQVGVRDEAKIVGGLGICGRVQCCKLFMRDFDPINIRMAKAQRLPLNPSKIFGPCGRLLCCLKHEYSVYKQIRKTLPNDGSIVETKAGKGQVIDLNVIKQTVIVNFDDGRIIETPASEVRVIDGKKKDKNEKK
ncbi:MAG: regulatory iron-sulfur-containing complex subunit RicT [Candidatus Theseobacter exili]|nr:regulatory iron-sulfur-containing complex subunit RicT [Candidatus Theseobacter exili]